MTDTEALFHYSKILHGVFDTRQEGDYKAFAESSAEDAAGFIKSAEKFIELVKKKARDEQ